MCHEVTFKSRCSAFRRLFLCAPLALWAGCLSLREDFAARFPNVEPPEAAAAETPPAGESESTSAEPAKPLPPLERLKQGSWRSMPAESLKDHPGAYRWRHEGVEALVSQRELPADLSDEISVPAQQVDFAIVRARRGDRSAARDLVAAIADSSLETNQRSAAAETLGRLAAGPAAMDELLRATAGENAVPPGVEAEIVLAAASRQHPLDPRRVSDAAAAPLPDLRAAALAWHASTREPLSQRALDLRTDPDPRVRLAWVSAVAATCSLEVAVEQLSKALREGDLHARLAVVRALGTVPSPAARELAQKQIRDPGELIRAAAVEALAQHEDQSTVVAATSDASWRVRKSAAIALSKFPSPQAAAAVTQLLTDQSPEVELAAVDAAAAWPLAQAGPLLLTACGQNALSTRERAAAHLAGLWAPAKEFSATAPPERRVEMLAQLRAAWNQEFGSGAREALASAQPGGAPEIADYEAIRSVVAELAHERSTDARRRLLSRLRGFGPELPAALEKIALTDELYLDDDIYLEVLPQFDPQYRVLAQLESPDLQARREASGRLAAQAAQEPLAGLVLLRLARQVPREQDPVVWHNVWRMLNDNGSEPALRIAYVAVDHSLEEVRRQGCEHLGRQGNPAHAPALFAALGDRSPNVARAAASALGHCGPLSDVAPLSHALAARDPNLRFAAAVSLARLGSDEGFAALERFTYEGDSERRQESAVAMGELGDERFLPALIRLLDDRDSVRRAALTALARIAGEDVARPAGEPAPPLSEQVERWRAWHAARASAPSEPPQALETR